MDALSVSGKGNSLLGALPLDVLADLEGKLQAVELQAGTCLCEAGSPLRYAYFPVTAVVSLFSPLRDGNGTEIAVVGREGVVGIGAFMGSSAALSSAVVQRSGTALRVRAHHIEELSQDAHVVKEFLRYCQVLVATIAQTSACHSNHSLYEQLCSWLLQHLDRQEDEALYITQERISSLLSVRRESITECALRLQREGVIHYQRGLVQVLDRAKLEHGSCECYGVIARLLFELDQHQTEAQSNSRW